MTEMLTDLTAPSRERVTDWRAEAACRDEDGELFYLPDGAREDAPASVARLDAAKAVCRMCPVVTECLRWALDTGDQDAVAGGTTPGERRAMRRPGRAVALGLPSPRRGD